MSPEEWRNLSASIARYHGIANTTPCSHVWTPNADDICQRRGHVYESDIAYAQEILDWMGANLYLDEEAMPPIGRMTGDEASAYAVAIESYVTSVIQ